MGQASIGSRISSRVGRGLQKVFRLFGIDVFRWHSDRHYVLDYFGKTAYKQIDIRGLEPFGKLAKEAIESGRTLLYYDRLYAIYQALAKSMKSVPGGEAGINIAEVGVFRGGTGRFMLNVASVLDLRKATLYCFDTFQGHDHVDVVAGRDLPAVQAPGSFSNTAADDVADYLKDAGETVLAVGRFQDTCGNFADRRFSFVHLDVDLYQPTVAGLEFFSKRLTEGGAIIVDDYGIETCPGVRQAVDEFTERNPGVFKFHLLSGQCLLHF